MPLPDGKRMKLIQINTVCNTSTGRIMGDIQREAMHRGYDALSLLGRRKPFADLSCAKYGGFFSFWLHVAVNTLFDRQGFASVWHTKRMVQRIRKEAPDIIHLHNLHGYYLNLPILFRYLHEEYKGRIFWTFHDCWPFTGHCPYFTMVGCQRWKSGCAHCPNRKNYPGSFLVDASARNYAYKKKIFNGFQDLTVIVPSRWMQELVAESFMKNYPCEVVFNGIDRETFVYTRADGLCDKYSIPRDKKILIGVANVWDRRKGLEDFLKLSGELPEEYRILLVGLSELQIRGLPENVTGIRRMENRRELAALYSMAEIFINPSREESFSLVTAEALSCGTPVIVLATSAVKELVTEGNGVVIEDTEVSTYLKAIADIEAAGLKRDKVAETAIRYDRKKMAERIVSLYGERYGR